MERDSVRWTEVSDPEAPGYPGDRVAAPAGERDRAGEDGGEDEGGGRRWVWIAAGAAALVLAALGLAWWLGLWPFGGEPEEQAQGGRADRPVPVSAQVVGLSEIPLYYDYNALTRASREADIRPRVSATVEEVAFDEGADVEEGQLLYRLDARPFDAALAQADAELESAEASLAFAEAQVVRFTELSEEGFATGERYDQALARREELRGQIAAIRARREAARLDRQYTEVRAPFAGRAGLSRLHEGELASPGGEPLTTVVRLDPVELRFAIRDDELPRIRRAMQDGPLRVVLLLSQGEAYAEYGRVVALDNAIDAGTGTLTAVAEFPNPGGLILPGRFVEARLLLGRADAVLIPSAALSALQDRRVVFLVGPEGSAVSTPVEVGRTFGERVVVTRGLRPGDRIVTSNLQSVRDGATLEVDDALPPAPPPIEEDGRAATAAPAGALTQDRPDPLPPEPMGAGAPPQGADLIVGPGAGPGAAPATTSPGGGPPLVGARPPSTSSAPTGG